MKADHTNYCSFLLRIWRVTDPGYGWRVLLENVMTGEQQAFPDIASLIQFIKELTSTERPAQGLARQTE